MRGNNDESEPKEARGSGVPFLAPGIGTRIKAASEAIGSRAEAAAAAGVSDDMLYRYIREESPARFAAIVGLASRSGFSLEWMATGREGVAAADEAGQYETSGAALPGDYTLIPHLDVEVSTGGGAVVDEEEEVNHLAFVRKYLKKRGVKPEAARLVTARGDSMETTISDGDTLLVDTSVHELRADSIYCIQVDGNLRAKRVQRDMRGGVWVISDNPQYEDEHLSAADAADLQIAGRVVWIGRDV